MKSFFASVMVTALLLSGLAAGNAISGELRSDLETHLQILPDDAQVSVIIHLYEQADIQSLDLEFDREKATRQVRHEQVMRALKEAAQRSQPALIEYLEKARRQGHITGFTPYWISNMIIVKATKSEINRLVNRYDVDFIEPNFEVELIRPVTSGSGGNETNGIGVTPGLKAINADRVWKELGITGAGRLVANLDTGVSGNHPALDDRWRGTLPGVHWSEAWLDRVYGGSQFPADYYSHGTHVMGTLTGLGEATGDTVGVAFGAYWIACNAIDQGVGGEFDNDVIAAFQWFADPDGDPGTIDDVPDVIQNSWRIAAYFGGSYQDCDDRWDAVIDNCEAAGTVVTFSAGNEGPYSQSHGSPANRADSEFRNFSVGAIDATNYNYPYPIADFSSRGPTDCVGSDHPIKPEVVAPGVDVYSSVPGGGYAQNWWSGTSMAGPHAAGVVALMREANPNLTVNQIKSILLNTADDFGTSGNDNTYGYGLVDAYAAVQMAMSEPPDVSVTITPDNPPIEVAPGGSFTFEGSVTNNSAYMVYSDAWIMVDIPGWGIFGPVFMRDNIRIQASQTLTRPGLSQQVPVGAPLGLYTYTAYSGFYPSNPSDSSSFDFTVTSGAGSQNESNWMTAWPKVIELDR
jgi:bacillopeptidase F